MKLSSLLDSVTTVSASDDGVNWYPARPQTAENTFLIYRIKAAWRVLLGHSDAIEWDRAARARGEGGRNADQA